MTDSVDREYIIARILGILDTTYANKTKDAEVIRRKLKDLVKELENDK